MVISNGHKSTNSVGTRLKSQRPRKNSVDGFTDVVTLSSAQNNSCFLEKQLLLVKRAQEMLLDEYRLGNSSKTQQNRPIYRGIRGNEKLFAGLPRRFRFHTC